MVSKKLCEVRWHAVANFLVQNFVGTLHSLVRFIAHLFYAPLSDQLHVFVCKCHPRYDGIHAKYGTRLNT